MLFRSVNAGGFIWVSGNTLGYTPDDGEKLFLLTPSGSHIVDAVKAGHHPKARFPDGQGSFHRPVSTTPGGANAVAVESDIVINKILCHGYPDPGTAATAPVYSATGVIDYGDTWRYENTGAGQSAGWSELAHESWSVGPIFMIFFILISPQFLFCFNHFIILILL